MTLPDAVQVLQAVEVGKPLSAYELTIITHHAKGAAAPRGRVSLPKDPRTTADVILVFADGKQAEAAKKLGVAHVGGEELIEPILSEKIRPTKILCTPSLLPKISKLARFLGPKGLMPATRRGTVTDDISGTIRSIAGTLDWKGDKEGVVRVPIGRLHYSPEELRSNVDTFIKHVEQSTKGKDDSALDSKKKSSLPGVLRVFLSSTQGPGIPLTL